MSAEISQSAKVESPDIRSIGDENVTGYRPRGMTASSACFSIPESNTTVQPSITDPNPTPSLRPSISSAYRPDRGPISREPSMGSFTKEPPRPLPWMDNPEARVSVKSFRSAWTTGSAMTYDSSVPPETSETERSSITSSYEILPAANDIEKSIGRESITVDDVMDMYYDFSDADDDDSYYKQAAANFFEEPGFTFDNDDTQKPQFSMQDIEDSERKASPTDSLLTKELPNSPSPILDIPQDIFNRDSAVSPVSTILDTPGTEFPGPSPLRQHPIDREFPVTDPEEHETPPTPPFKVPEPRDRYGFKKTTREITLEQYDAWNEGYTEYLDRRRSKWDVLMTQYGLDPSRPNRFPPKSDKVKRYVRKGIPPEWRGAAWFWYAGGPEQLRRHPGQYQQLVLDSREHLSEIDQDMIERDLHRTFPDSIKFKPDPSDKPPTPPPALPGRDVRPQRADTDPETHIVGALRRVLQAFALNNPSIGYCQSLNFLAGMLLLMLNEDEEKAFILLEVLTTVHFPGIHAKILEANVDIGVLMSFIQESMPAVWTKINDIEESGPKNRSRTSSLVSTKLPTVTLALTPWFMSLFLNTLPIESALRVWDILFYEGSKSIFRVALALFKLGEPEIRAIGDPLEIFQVVQALPRRMLDVNVLIEATFRRRGGFAGVSVDTVEQRRTQRRILTRKEQANNENNNRKRERGMTLNFDRSPSLSNGSLTPMTPTGSDMSMFPYQPPPVPEGGVAAFMASRPSMDHRRPATRDGSFMMEDRKSVRETSRGRMANVMKKVTGRGTSRSAKRREKDHWEGGWQGMEAN
jgi:hypothetical protein